MRPLGLCCVACLGEAIAYLEIYGDLWGCGFRPMGLGAPFVAAVWHLWGTRSS